MKIDLLYFNGFPSWQNGLTNLQTALREEKLEISIHLVEVKSELESTGMKFLGSPSFQIDGQDFWPEDRQAYSINCRVYTTHAGLKGWPSADMLRQKIIEIMEEKDQGK